MGSLPDDAYSVTSAASLAWIAASASVCRAFGDSAAAGVLQVRADEPVEQLELRRPGR